MSDPNGIPNMAQLLSIMQGAMDLDLVTQKLAEKIQSSLSTSNLDSPIRIFALVDNSPDENLVGSRIQLEKGGKPVGYIDTIVPPVYRISFHCADGSQIGELQPHSIQLSGVFETLEPFAAFVDHIQSLDSSEPTPREPGKRLRTNNDDKPQPI